MTDVMGCSRTHQIPLLEHKMIKISALTHKRFPSFTASESGLPSGLSRDRNVEPLDLKAGIGFHQIQHRMCNWKTYVRKYIHITYIYIYVSLIIDIIQLLYVYPYMYVRLYACMQACICMYLCMCVVQDLNP